jgi:hypothetical protein
MKGWRPPTANASPRSKPPEGEAPLLRDGPWLSENARRTYQELIGPDFLKRFKLADKIERGDADQSSDEQDILYETYPDLVDLATDLFNMVSRRDERIVELEREVQAYAEAEAGASL